MNEAEFQKLLNAAPPVTLPAHRGKLFARTLCRTFFIFRPNEIFFQIGLLGKMLQWQEVEAYALLLDREYFIIRGNRSIRHRWADVEEFRMAKNNIIYFNVTRGPYASKISRLITGQDFSFYNLYAIKTELLVKLLNHWRERALRQA